MIIPCIKRHTEKLLNLLCMVINYHSGLPTAAQFVPEKGTGPASPEDLWYWVL